MLETLLGSLIGAFVIVLAAMPSFIRYLKKKSVNQSVSEYSLEEYKKKDTTPVMGGVLFIASTIVVTLIACARHLANPEIWLLIIAFAGYGAIGFRDDYLIVIRHNNDGLTPRQKMGLQVLLAVGYFILFAHFEELSLHIPFTDKVWHLGWGYLILEILMLAGSSNAVNLTDGMDGLSAGCTEFSLGAFFVIACVQQKYDVAAFIAALMGSLFGYLVYNVKPARIFMGDTGSLALGGALAAIAMVLRSELALIVIGGTFVVETLCVIIQQVSVRTGHGKVFIYTPIHYAFQLKGMSDRHVVRMFWLVSLGFSLLGLWIGLH